ncbi:7198_t:CDS:2 [Funneliformis geosporum]|uniref:7198_t:CDS:1 n=1 Tax=Funneliformis geosporum TaxID=1117311 RepID=A0A9W4T7W6_9GLOM|nr:7198_t:CDS:2 [Funneliformis geosporum]
MKNELFQKLINQINFILVKFNFTSEQFAEEINYLLTNYENPSFNPSSFTDKLLAQLSRSLTEIFTVYLNNLLVEAENVHHLSEIVALRTKLDYFRSHPHWTSEQTQAVEKAYQQLGEKLKPKETLLKQSFTRNKSPIMPYKNTEINKLKQLIEQEKRKAIEQLIQNLSISLLDIVSEESRDPLILNLQNITTSLTNQSIPLALNELFVALNGLDTQLSTDLSELARLNNQLNNLRAENQVATGLQLSTQSLETRLDRYRQEAETY